MALQLWTGGDREDVDHFIDLIVDLVNAPGEAITSQDLRASLGTPSTIGEAIKKAEEHVRSEDWQMAAEKNASKPSWQRSSRQMNPSKQSQP